MTKFEPLRHAESERNRRKSLLIAEKVLEEMEFVYCNAMKMLTKQQYAIGKQHKLINRLRSEARR